MLSPEYRSKLQELVHHFMAEKSFEGCGGMELDDQRKIIISAMACVPLLGGVSDIYPWLSAILVYPAHYHAPYSEPDEGGVVSEGVESRSGESWDQGIVVLSWREVVYDLQHPGDGANIVFHECAHQLDYEWGATMEGFTWPRSRGNEVNIAAILKKEYSTLVERLERGLPVHIDDYAATNIHEFFAVMTETWFERRDIIRKYYPEVDRAMIAFYNMQGSFPG